MRGDPVYSGLLCFNEQRPPPPQVFLFNPEFHIFGWGQYQTERSVEETCLPQLSLLQKKQLLHNISLAKSLWRILVWQASLLMFTWQAHTVQGTSLGHESPVGAWCGWTSASEKYWCPGWPMVAVCNSEEVSGFPTALSPCKYVQKPKNLVPWNDNKSCSSQIPVEIRAVPRNSYLGSSKGFLCTLM